MQACQTLSISFCTVARYHSCRQKRTDSISPSCTKRWNECLWQNSIPSPPCSHLSLQFLLFSRRSIFRLLKDQHLFRAQRSAVHQVRDLATIHCSFCQLHVALIVSTFHPPERSQNTFTLLEASQSFERLNKPMVPKGLHHCTESGSKECLLQ